MQNAFSYRMLDERTHLISRGIGHVKQVLKPIALFEIAGALHEVCRVYAGRANSIGYGISQP
jgi:hypothetical protein